MDDNKSLTDKHKKNFIFGISSSCEGLFLGSGSTTLHLIGEILKSREKEGGLFYHRDLYRHAILPSYSEIIQLAYPSLPPRYQEIGVATEREKEVAPRVAKTVWILWGQEKEKMWKLMADWASEGGLVGEAAFEVIKIGLSDGQVDEKEAFSRIELLLLDDDETKQEAGVRLVFAISDEYIENASLRWVDSADDKKIERLPLMLRSLLGEKPFRTMKLFRKWLHGNNQKLHIAIKHSILEYAIPRGGPIEFYRDIIKELKGISLGLGRDQKGLIKKIREANDELSKVSNTRKGRKGDIKQKNFVEYGRKKRFQQRRSK